MTASYIVFTPLYVFIIIRKYKVNKGIRVLEVGCGRGTMSCYFSDAGYDCSLLDLSERAIEIAARVFEKEQLSTPKLVQQLG